MGCLLAVCVDGEVKRCRVITIPPQGCKAGREEKQSVTTEGGDGSRSKQ